MNSSLRLTSAESQWDDVDRQSALFRNDSWVDHSYPNLALTSAHPPHSPNRTVLATNDSPQSYQHTRPSSYTHSSVDHAFDATSRYQNKRFFPYPGGNVTSDGTSGGFNTRPESLRYNQGCQDSSSALLGEQSWDIASYCLPAATAGDDPAYYPSTLFSTESLSPRMNETHASPITQSRGYSGDALLNTNIYSQAYATNDRRGENDILPVVSQGRDDFSFYRHLLDGNVPHSQPFANYVSTPISSTIHSSMSANTSLSDRSGFPASSPLGQTSRSHRGSDLSASPSASQSAIMASQAGTSQFRTPLDWGPFSVVRQHQEVQALPSTSMAAAGSSQSVLKLSHHVKKSGTSEKKQTLACLFCRERKIACGRPPEGSADTTCNQCARRQFKCEYPKESRRGQHKRNRRKAHDVNDGY